MTINFNFVQMFLRDALLCYLMTKLNLLQFDKYKLNCSQLQCLLTRNILCSPMYLLFNFRWKVNVSTLTATTSTCGGISHQNVLSVKHILVGLKFHTQGFSYLFWIGGKNESKKRKMSVETSERVVTVGDNTYSIHNHRHFRVVCKLYPGKWGLPQPEPRLTYLGLSMSPVLTHWSQFEPSVDTSKTKIV